MLTATIKYLLNLNARKAVLLVKFVEVILLKNVNSRCLFQWQQNYPKSVKAAATGLWNSYKDVQYAKCVCTKKHKIKAKKRLILGHLLMLDVMLREKQLLSRQRVRFNFNYERVI